jgi:hypothetical protein
LQKKEVESQIKKDTSKIVGMVERTTGNIPPTNQNDTPNTCKNYIYRNIISRFKSGFFIKFFIS